MKKLLLLTLIFFIPLVSAATYFEDDFTAAPPLWTDVNSATHGYSGTEMWMQDTNSGLSSSARNFTDVAIPIGVDLNYTVHFQYVTETSGTASGFFQLLNSSNSVVFAIVKDLSTDELKIYNGTGGTQGTGTTFAVGTYHNATLLYDASNNSYELLFDGASEGEWKVQSPSSVSVVGFDLGGYSSSPIFNVSYDHLVVKDLSTGSSTLNISSILPTSNDHLNDNPVNFTFSINTTGGTADNVTLFINGTANITVTSISDGINNISSSIAEGTWNWFLNAWFNGNNTNTTTRTLVVDLTSPDWTVNAGNFFSADNSTVLNKNVNDSPEFDLTLDDTFLWAYNISIVNSTGDIVHTNQSTGLTSTQETFTYAVNISSWSSGVYNVTLYAEDDHTAKNIPAYGLSGFPGGMEWTTDRGTVIKVNTPGSSFSTEKFEDRYSFIADFSSPRNSLILHLSSSEELFYRGELYPFPSFVTGKHWVDFNIEGITDYSVTNQGFEDGFYKYQVRIDSANSDSWTFHSLGGLNNITEQYSFNISSFATVNESFINTSPYDINDGIEGFCNTEGIGLNVTFSWDWYKDGVEQGTSTICAGDTFVCPDGSSVSRAGLTCGFTPCPVPSGTIVGVENLTDSFISIGDEWVLTCQSFDGATLGNKLNSSSALIRQFVNFSFFDDVTGAVINNVTLELIAASFADSETTATGSIFYNFSEGEEVSLFYNSSGYSTTSTIITINSSTPASINLTLLSTGSTTVVSMLVFDELGDEVEGAIIKVLKFDLATNSFLENQVVTTNFEGEAQANLVQNDPFYKFIIEFNGITVFSSGSTQIFGDSLTFTVVLQDQGFEPLFQSFRVEGTVVQVDNNTFSFTWNDPGSEITQACFTAYRLSRTERSVHNQTCVSANSGSIFLDVDNTTGRTYELIGSVTADGENINIDSLIVTYADTISDKKLGNFLLWIVLMSVSFIAIFSIPISLILVGVFPVLFSATGISSFPLPYAIALFFFTLIMAGVVGFKN